MRKLLHCVLFLIVVSSISCKKKQTIKDDEIYSRHLQRHVKLSIINTPIPDDKSNLNLILLNDGQDMKELDIQNILDSLWNAKAIEPCVVVGIHAGDRNQEYGVADEPDYMNRGSKADKYSAFVNDELYPFAKKMSGVRKFKTVTIAGWSLGGLSAFDIAWNYSDKIDKVGVFSGSFWWRNKDAADSSYSDETNRIMINKIRSSRKKPSLQMWFYAGNNEEKDDRDKDGISDVVDDTRDLVALLKSKNRGTGSDVILKESPDGTHDLQSWKKVLPEFLKWALRK